MRKANRPPELVWQAALGWNNSFLGRNDSSPRRRTPQDFAHVGAIADQVISQTIAAMRRRVARESGALVADPCFQRAVAKMHDLGPLALAEFIAEITAVTGRADLIRDRLKVYVRINAVQLARVGGDRFPPRQLFTVWP